MSIKIHPELLSSLGKSTTWYTKSLLVTIYKEKRLDADCKLSEVFLGGTLKMV